MAVMTEEQIKAYLMEHNEEFRRLAEQHASYEKQLQEIESKPHVTPEDELEEARIKKLKLQVKDRMQMLIDQFKASQRS